MPVTGRFLAWAGLAGLLAGGAAAVELQGTLQGRRTITAAESPLRIPTTLTVPAGAVLRLEPGVVVQLGAGACLVVRGQLQALGDKRAPIRFEPLGDDVRWGNVKILGDKDPPCYDGDRHYLEDSGGSRLLFCEFRGGGQVPDQQYDGGALYLNGSAPIVKDCLFQGNQADRGGALVCYNFATPLIEGCTFEGNSSLLDDGGALYCFFYSDAQILRNFFVQNSSARHAGGLYVSVSNPLVQENAFIDNTATGWGGALYVSSSSPRILDNALYEASAEERSTGLVFQSDCRPEVRGNSLQSGGVEVYGLNLGGDLDLGGNWWGTTDEFAIQGKVQQRGRGQDRKLAIAPWRDRPVSNLLTQPVEILSLQAMVDAGWADTLAFDLCDGALARLQVLAVDRNRYAVDQTIVEARVLERPVAPLTLILVESDKASGVFRGRLALGRDEEDLPALRVAVGEHVLFSSATNPDLRRLYRVDEARPVVHGLTVLSESDPTHAVAATQQVGWQYFSLLGEPLSAWHLQVSTDSTFARPEMWDSGPVPAPAPTRVLTYAGSPLQDGERYFLRLRCQGGGAWSAWKRFVVRTDNAEATLRMNSLPPVPGLLEPAAEAVLPLLRPTLRVAVVRDREGDTVSYQFQVAADEYFQQVLAGSEARTWREPAWTLDRDLAENSACWWRVRVLDGYEEGAWSAPRRVHLNAVEEAPLPFALTGPSGAIADLAPEFLWSAATDPDPLAQVAYTLLVAAREDLSQAERVTGLQEPAARLKHELANGKPAWWAVEAQDNSGRVTRSRQVLGLTPDSTPSTPRPLFPTGGEETLAGQRLRFTPSQDPWPADRLLYELQVITEGGSFDKPLISLKGLGAQELAATSLDALAESRLLAEDRAHAWRLRAVDNHGAASAWSEPAACWLNRSNSPPARPEAGLAPADGALLRQAPGLSWNAVADPDHTDPPSSLTYVVQLCREPDFKGEVIEERLTGQTRLELEGRIADDARWHWRVQALDNENAASGWSAARALVYNRADQPPAGLAWLQPAEGATQARLDQVELAWQAATDPDWDARLTYSWRLSPAAEPGRTLAQGTTSGTQAVAKASLASRADYLLLLSVKDETGLEQVLPPRHLRVDSHPTPPVLTVTQEELALGDALTWQAATDPDPADRLSYRINLKCETGKAMSATMTGTQAQLGRLPGIELLPEDKAVAWTVSAVDPHGLEAISAEGRFWLNRANTAPGAPAFSAELVAAGTLRTDRPAIAFTPGRDPDHGDPPATLWHELQVAAGATFQGAVIQRVEAGQVSLPALALGDNARWHLRLRCLDNEGATGPWSPPIQLLVNLRDDAPSAPVVGEPSAGQRLFDLGGLNVAWQAATDPDLEARLRYRVVLQDDAGAEVARRETTQTRLRFDQALQNDGAYRVQVTALDETGLETAAPPVRVTVDSRPGATTLVGSAGQVLGAADLLAWSAATDPDPADKLSYSLEWASSRAFADPHPLSVAGLKQVLGALKGLPENGEVWLRVRAVDPHHLEGPWSEARQVTYDAIKEKPTAPAPLGPADGFEQVAGSVAFSWKAGQDPDPGPAPRHRLVLSGSGGERREEASGEALSLDLAPGTWTWRVEAVDAGGLSASSTARRLVLSSPPAPTPPGSPAP